MKIRRARHSDLEEMVGLGEEFWESTRYFAEGVPYNAETVANLTSAVMNSGIVQVVEDKGELQGFILCIVTPWVFNVNFIAATELAYYVRDEYRNSGAGKALIRQAENIAKQLGCKYLTMVSLSTSPKHVGRFYEMLGYSRSETSYSKHLG